MTPITALGLSIRLSMFELRETGDWDIFLGPLERARAEAGGADQWVLKRRELARFAIVNGKKRPHPWDTHHQFSIKTLLSKATGTDLPARVEKTHLSLVDHQKVVVLEMTDPDAIILLVQFEPTR